jgi:hypothetical protein
MKLVFAFLLAVHGLIHMMGFAKAFRLAELPQLTHPPSRGAGAAWLIATGLFVATLVAYVAWPRGWWALGAAAIALSQILVFRSWTDARWGTLANVLVLAGVALGFLSQGPSSMRAEYRREVERRLAREGSPPLVTEQDLAHLPAVVARYLRVTGSVGQPRVESFRATMRGEIRSGPTDPWMPFVAEQHNFYDEPARLFFMEATRAGVPFQALHLYVGPAATMRVKVAALFPVIDARGPDMDQAETVTLFNDMCLLAPATLVDRRIQWEAVDAHTARASFSHAGHTVRAELSFDDAGELVGFWSDDRLRSSPDGTSFTRMRWSTPTGDYRAFGARRVGVRGEARWAAPEGEFAYVRFELIDIAYNVGGVSPPPRLLARR